MTGAGFPTWNTLTPSRGVVKWALIPIDFEDLPGEQNFRSRVNDQMALLSEWFATVSGGKYRVEWVVLDKWARVAGKSTDYRIDRSVNVGDAANGPKLFGAAMDAADPDFDFTNIQTVNFILPKGQTFLAETSQGFPWDQVVKDYRSKEGKIDSYSIPGMFFDLPGKAYWAYWAHEFGHAIGLPHIGASRGDLPPFNPWDLMGGQDGPSRELSGWLRFFAGWLNDDQVYCKDASQVQDLKISLVPLSETASGVKFVVIPVTQTKAVLIESRRETKFSCPTTPARNGVLVYTYDATLGHGENFLTPVHPAGRPNQIDSCSAQNSRGVTSPDVLLKEGQSIEVQGLTIEILSVGPVDKILVTRK
jgi:M6 family metalloprotease-like protein